LAEIKALRGKEQRDNSKSSTASNFRACSACSLFYMHCWLHLPEVRPSSMAMSKESSTMQRHPAQGEK
jgi:hypothetical protein